MANVTNDDKEFMKQSLKLTILIASTVEYIKYTKETVKLNIEQSKEFKIKNGNYNHNERRKLIRQAKKDVESFYKEFNRLESKLEKMEDAICGFLPDKYLDVIENNIDEIENLLNENIKIK